MLKGDCKVGMRVIFGREKGEKTRGVVIKMNPSRARVQATEDRGVHDNGAVWQVPYSLIEPAHDAGVETAHDAGVETVVFDRVTKPDPADVPIKYSAWCDRVEHLTLEAINVVYNRLSPENLTCDGELPRHMVMSRQSKLRRQLRGLFNVLGREVSECAAYKWYDEMLADKQARSQHPSIAPAADNQPPADLLVVTEHGLHKLPYRES